MGKSNGGTRGQGPAQTAGGRTTTPVDEYAAWRASESTEKYTYNPETVKFSVDSLDMGDAFTRAEMSHKSDYEFVAVQKDMRDGKYHINEGEYIYNEPRTFNQAINEAVRFAKERYQNNERNRDTMFQVRNYDDDNAPSAWVTAELVDNGKVRIRVSKFHA